MIGLRYFSMFGTSGYAESARRYLTAFAKMGVPVTWSPVVSLHGPRGGFKLLEGRSAGDPELDPLCNLPIPYDTVLLHVLPWYYPTLLPVVQGKRIAAYAVWETERIPPQWTASLKNIEFLFIPCEGNRKAFRDGGFEGPIEVVPHSLAPGQSPLPDPPEDRGEFVFYSINTWEPRKAIDRTLLAYLRAFRRADKVRLILKTSERGRLPFFPWYPVSTDWHISRILRQHLDPPAVTVLTARLSNEEILNLHRDGNCYVSLTRSEGWGLGAFDAAASGRPVIMTGLGGQTEFLPAELLVKYEAVTVPFLPLEPYARGQHWAEADTEHAAQLMRHVFENRGACAARAREHASQVCATYRHDRVAAALLQALRKHF